jgi:hypothetical protein
MIRAVVILLLDYVGYGSVWSCPVVILFWLHINRLHQEDV